ncbi:hypothetical protein [Pseudomonas sp. GV071]|uniref:hypothetical protein n=1 Tax=Pseudomonas sp. GV071 TaxID=2135754 RepID=UPI000D45E89C|nr:hypothetical protein [Pseudomonas sp. GV071]
MNTSSGGIISGCWRALKRTWFLITESDPPEKPKPGIRVFGPAPPPAAGGLKPPQRKA